MAHFVFFDVPLKELPDLELRIEPQQLSHIMSIPSSPVAGGRGGVGGSRREES